MSLKKSEKLSYVGGPFLFSIVLIICGIIVSKAAPERLHGIVLICSGLICMSLYCVCGLLAKMVDSGK